MTDEPAVPRVTLPAAEVVRLRSCLPMDDPKSHDFGYGSSIGYGLNVGDEFGLGDGVGGGDEFRFDHLLIMLLLVLSLVMQASANEQPAASTVPQTHQRSAVNKILSPPWFDPRDLLSLGHPTRFEMPSRPRVSRSASPLRLITLVTGDRFVAESLSWGPDTADFRLQSGTAIHVPVASICRISNPPGETDVLVEPFESDPPLLGGEKKFGGMLDQTHAASGHSSLRISPSPKGYRHLLQDQMGTSRIEFQFLVERHDPSADCGEWTFEWIKSDLRITVRVDGDGTVSVPQCPFSLEPMIQALRLSEGWHSFIAIFGSDRTRLIVDDAFLAVCHTPDSVLDAIQFRPTNETSKNQFWIDNLQIRRIGQPRSGSFSISQSLERDMIVTEQGVELFGHIRQVTDRFVVLESLGRKQPIPWSFINELTWSQPPAAIPQSIPTKSGLVSRIQMQPFTDRPYWEPEQWSVTVTSVESTHLVVQHGLVGEWQLPWSEVSRIEPLFWGQTQSIDARRFHLGNSIRTDLNRHLPDGRELKREFSLSEIPSGRSYFSLDVAELEASGPAAPPASPFLADLREGNLITELVINDQSLGSLNEHLRFKSTAERPERIRIPIPSGLLKAGPNVFQLRQRPLKPGGQEYDDGEVGHFSIDFEK